VNRRAIIVGAGPAGLASAIALARAGWDAVVLERRPQIEQKICGECLSPPCRELLRELGAWERLPRGSVLDVGGITITGPRGGRCRLDFGDDPAFTVPRAVLDGALLEAARAAGARVELGVAVERIERRQGGFRLSGREAGTWEGGLLVGADGRRSAVANAAGLWPRRPHWLRRTAVMGHFRLPTERAARVEMIVRDWGYFGVNPLPGGFVNGIAVLAPERFQARAGDGRGARAALLELAKDAVPGLEPAGDRVWAASPLAWLPRAAAADGVALVGDSAGFVDPFTGEGLFHALSSARQLARLAPDLGAYARWHRGAFGPEERFCSLLQRLLPHPRLSEYVLARLEARPELRRRLALAVADRIPITEVLAPAFWARLLLPGEATA
jgi:2-polyprenyl-6-methoxyphenol hydroxylase-like FAD-dependent oxidoreductase